MRLLAAFSLLLCLCPCLAGAAAAAGPRFALFDLQSDLSHASRNPYGDVRVRPLAQVAGKGTLVRCGASCRFGSGWLVFRAAPHLSAADVSAAHAGYSKRLGWNVALALRPAAAARWRLFAKHVAAGTKLRGVPDVLVVVAGGQVAASPFATQVSSASGTVTLTGFSRSSATALARLLR